MGMMSGDWTKGLHLTETEGDPEVFEKIAEAYNALVTYDPDYCGVCEGAHYPEKHGRKLVEICCLLHNVPYRPELTEPAPEPYGAKICQGSPDIMLAVRDISRGS